MVIDSTIPSLADEPFSPVVTVRMAAMSDIPSILCLHREAFADKFGGAFGNNGVERGMEAMAAAWRRQGVQALRGMYVAVAGQEVVATATLRTWEMSSDDGGAAELAFQQVLGLWGATRSIFALSLLDHRIERGEGFITDVAVLSPYRRQGIAQLLLKRAEEDARLRQKRYLGLYVSSANAGARELYRRMGFYDVKQRHSWLTRVMFGQRSWVYMRKDLHAGTS